MQFGLKLVESNKDIQQLMLNAMLPDVKKFMDNGIAKIKSGLPPIVQQAIRNTPEYDSLSSGKLKYEFGIAGVDSKLSSLLNIWSTNISYSYQAPRLNNNKIKAYFSASMIKADFSDVLYADYAAVVDTVRGYSLPWLEWLLLEGNKTIIKNYEVVLGPSLYSRTGSALMQSSRRSWSVPSEFAGTINDNWITRAIDGAAPEIEKLLDGVFS